MEDDAYTLSDCGVNTVPDTAFVRLSNEHVVVMIASMLEASEMFETLTMKRDEKPFSSLPQATLPIEWMWTSLTE